MLTQASTRLRIQVINLDGVVIGDTDLSDHALAGVENHSDRPEFQQALKAGLGSDVRFPPSPHKILLPMGYQE